MVPYRGTVREFLSSALKEDIGTGDLTTGLIVPSGHTSEAVILGREDFVLAGLPFAGEVFELLDRGLSFQAHLNDGEEVKAGQRIATLRGPTRAILTGERVALNILQRLSGIATLTRRFAELISGTGARLLDTRKTTPGMRCLEKYAVRIGGGHNHRFGLYDGILIKDNHITAAGGISRAVECTREGAHHLMKIEVEVKGIEELKEALQAGADVVMLDNMPVETIREAVGIVRGRSPGTLVEASGGVGLENIREIALTGVDFISVGALTHSARAVDISLEILEGL